MYPQYSNKCETKETCVTEAESTKRLELFSEHLDEVKEE